MAENRDTKVTPQEALLELATRKARNNLACFTLYTFPKFKMGWFHESGRINTALPRTAEPEGISTARRSSRISSAPTATPE